MKSGNLRWEVAHACGVYYKLRHRKRAVLPVTVICNAPVPVARVLSSTADGITCCTMSTWKQPSAWASKAGATPPPTADPRTGSGLYGGQAGYESSDPSPGGRPTFC